MIVLLLVGSAGVGRTGAFMAVDCLLDQAEAEDVFTLTNLMRKDRINMIQTVVSTSSSVLPVLISTCLTVSDSVSVVI